jgi:hypothetical protein
MTTTATLRLFARTFLSAPDLRTLDVIALASQACNVASWVELHGVVVAAATRVGSCCPLSSSLWSFALDDGTGVVPCTARRDTTTAAVGPALGDFVVVRGRAKEYRGRRELDVRQWRREADPNAEPLAWLTILDAATALPQLYASVALQTAQQQQPQP